MGKLADEVRLRQSLPPQHEWRAIREGAQVPVMKVATDVGAHPSTVTRWELGISHPRGERIERYARALATMKRLAQ
jgi:hypothetical protein